MNKKFNSVAELLEAPERWTQGVLARRADGDPWFVNSDEAVCWSLVGAIERVYRNTRFVSGVCWRVGNEVNNFPQKWNDDPERTHAEVLALCRKLNI